MYTISYQLVLHRISWDPVIDLSNNNTITGTVNSVLYNPSIFDSPNYVYLAGDFVAGDCKYFCLYNMKEKSFSNVSATPISAPIAFATVIPENGNPTFYFTGKFVYNGTSNATLAKISLNDKPDIEYLSSNANNSAIYLDVCHDTSLWCDAASYFMASSQGKALFYSSTGTYSNKFMLFIQTNVNWYLQVAH